MSTTKSDRSTQMTIRLEPKIKDGLYDIASRFGVAPTSIAAMAIGEYVAKNHGLLQNQAFMLEATARELAKVIGGPIGEMIQAKALEELNGDSSND